MDGHRLSYPGDVFIHASWTNSSGEISLAMQPQPQRPRSTRARATLTLETIPRTIRWGERRHVEPGDARTAMTEKARAATRTRRHQALFVLLQAVHSSLSGVDTTLLGLFGIG